MLFKGVVKYFMTYEMFAYHMYRENCRERSAYRTKPYDCFEDYEAENKNFLKKVYKKYDSE